jgi:ADP-ribosyl-[dinitrogen reductase] hydrolase
MTTTATIRDRARAAYLGFALGDALGATVEFMTPREIAATYGTHDRIVGGGWLKLAPGQVTDDTTMSLALGRAIVDARGWNLRAAADAFAAWLRAGPVDCGNTCRRGIRRYLTDGSLSGPPNEADAGNGALMRNLAVVLATLGNEALRAQWSIEQAHITHNHPLSDAVTLAFGRITAQLIEGYAWHEIIASAATLVAAHPRLAFAGYEGPASGYVADTARTVLHQFFIAQDLASCVVATVNRGEDADTNGALAGMLCGARWGTNALPPTWLKRLDPAVHTEIEHQAVALVDLALARRPAPFLRPDPQ